MKAQILKIAGVKSEKEFYKKYPSEEDFMKVHGKAFKKAQMGTRIGKNIPKAYVGADLPEWAVDAAETVTDTTTAYPANVGRMYGIGAQTMGRMQGAAAPVNQPGTQQSYGPGGINYTGPQGPYPPDTSNPNWMVKNTSGAPYASGNITQSNDYKMGEIDDQTSSSSPFNIVKAIPVVGGIIGGIQALGAQKEAKRAAKQAKKVSDLSLAASSTRPEETRRRYVTPWDNPVQPGQVFPAYGVGTNPLARNGAILQSGGEIQNTYAPDYLYDNLGYEPLDDSNVKQYYDGGDIPVAADGMQWGLFSKGGAGFGENPYGGLVSGMMGNNNAGSQLGGSIGSIFGPGGGLIGSAIGGILDTDQDDIDRYNKETMRNVEGMGINNMMSQMQSVYGGHMKNGGYMNPEYNPQVITMFGDHTAEDFADYAHKYRAGGHLKSYTAPSERAMETYAMGGQLKTHWGGGAETLSYNPYMPGSGETVLFRGQSHTDSDGKGNTGIGITYGDNPVEVERGEPMFEMQAGGEINPETGEPENTGVVFGNMQIDKKVASQFNDPELMEIANKYHGKKFKNIGIELAKQEAKQNKTIAKNTDILDSLKVETSLDKARLAALKANIEGADAKLKSIANTKIILANYQNAINDSKDELSEIIGSNISAEELAKGKVKLDKDPVTMNAKWGGNIIKRAQNGITFKNDAEARLKGYKWTGKYEADGKTKIYERTIKKFSNTDTESKDADALGYVPKGQKKNTSGLWGKVTPEMLEAAKKANSWYPGWKDFDPNDKNDVMNYQMAFNARAKSLGSTANINVDGDFGEQTVTARIDESKKSNPNQSEETLRATVAAPDEQPQQVKTPKIPWLALAANTLLPYFRPSDQEAFDQAQIYPEMFAMATNQLEPVPAQGYRPDLGIPYDISFQDQLNANQADYNASQRMVGYNPAAQAVLNAQKYAANTGVLGSQFRANQELRDRVYGENRNILNQAKITNLDIFDRQYGRQAEARSNTKATTQAALSSIADKYAKHKLENRTLGIYENMYNYRFGKNGRAQNYNPLQIFDTEMSGSKSQSDQSMPGYKATSYDKDGNVLTWKKITSNDDVDDTDLGTVGGKRNGGSVKKNNKNSSIVRAFKNL